MKLFQRKIPAIRVGAMTSTGNVREENQDNMSRFFSPLGEVFVVADGMGGHKGGALAAEMVTRGLEDYLSQIEGNIQIPNALRTATQNVNEAIHREATSGNPDTEGMGSTVVLAVLSGELMHVGNVGDSRAYLFRKGRLQRLTRDHTRIQKMVDGGILTEAEGREHPDASILNRNMGGKSNVDIEVYEPVPIQEGDVFLLCTDGLCGYILDDAIGRIIAPLTDAQATAEALVDISLQAGGEDNVTVQVIQCGQRKPCAFIPAPVQSPKRTAVPVRARKNRWVWILGLVALFVLVLGGGIALGIHAPWQKDLPPEKPKTEKTLPIRPKPVAESPKPLLPPEEPESETNTKEAVNTPRGQILMVVGRISAEDKAKLKKVLDEVIVGRMIIEKPEIQEYITKGPVVWFAENQGSVALKLKQGLGYPQAVPMPKEIRKLFPSATCLIVPGPQELNSSDRRAHLSESKSDQKLKPNSKK